MLAFVTVYNCSPTGGSYSYSYTDNFDAYCVTWLTWNMIAVGKYGEVWICTRLSRMTVRWVRALFRQRGGGGDVVVVALVVASRTMLQSVVDPNTCLLISSNA